MGETEQGKWEFFISWYLKMKTGYIHFIVMWQTKNLRKSVKEQNRQNHFSAV